MSSTIKIIDGHGYMRVCRRTGTILSRQYSEANADIAFVLPRSIPNGYPIRFLWEVEFVTDDGEHRGKLAFAQDSNDFIERLTPVALLAAPTGVHHEKRLPA